MMARAILHIPMAMLAVSALVAADKMPRYVECRQNGAEVKLAISVWLPGRSHEERDCWYFRTPVKADDGEQVFRARHGGSCGENVGSTDCCFVTPEVRETDVLLKVSASAKAEAVRSSLELQIPVQFGTERKGTISGVRYEATWLPVLRSDEIPSTHPSSVMPPVGTGTAPTHGAAD
jgi:hypothetical protein